jgi:hypothetical protein
MKNTFFNNETRTSEQELLENLVIETIKIYGQEMIYLPRRFGNLDQLTYSDDQAYFDTAYPIELYIKSVDGFSGDRVFMSKFDIEIRDQVIFTVARRRFELEIASKEEFIAPREKDLIYFPMNRKLFQIMFSDNKPFFYQLGNLQMYDMTCENFEYSSERFMTGIAEIDSFQKRHTQNILDFGILGHDGSYLVDHNGNLIVSSGYQDVLDLDIGDDNVFIQDEVTTLEIIDFSEKNPYAEKDY